MRWPDNVLDLDRFESDSEMETELIVVVSELNAEDDNVDDRRSALDERLVVLVWLMVFD